MVQNRNKLIDLFIGNISNSIVHNILEKATEDELIAKRYNKELTTSWEIAGRYREKINPVNAVLPAKDLSYIRTKIASKVNSELLFRISKGYQGIDLSLVETFVVDALKGMKIL